MFKAVNFTADFYSNRITILYYHLLFYLQDGNHPAESAVFRISGYNCVGRGSEQGKMYWKNFRGKNMGFKRKDSLFSLFVLPLHKERQGGRLFSHGNSCGRIHQLWWILAILFWINIGLLFTHLQSKLFSVSILCAWL